MKKRIIAVIILLTVIILCCACSNNENLEIGMYRSAESTKYGYAEITLSENNEFVFGVATYSYCPSGKYTVEGNALILTVNEEEKFIFTIDDEKLIFESGEWAEKVLDKGTVFQLFQEEE